MNYTENYHLPQWVKTDRIMMEDFNQMCADIETGLTGAGDRLNSAVSEFREGIKEARETDRALDRRLSRLMYNHYSMLRAMDPFPRQTGVFYQDPVQITEAETPGVMLLDGAVYMANTDLPTVSSTEFLASIKEIQAMQIVKGNLEACKPQILTFTAPRAGAISGPSVNILFQESSSTFTVFNVLVELKNLDSGETAMRRALRYEVQPGFTSDVHRNIDFKLYFCSGRYQITVTPLNAPASGKVSLTCATGHVDFFARAAGASFRQGFCDLEGCEEAMVILRFKGGGTGGKMTFQWNGEEMPPTYSREVPLDDGRLVQENIYCRTGNVPKCSEFVVNFQCGAGSDFWFYDWGGIFC